MRYNGDGMSKVLSKLNESTQNIPTVEPELTVGVDPIEEIHQCAACGGFFKGNPENCPVCGGVMPKVNESRNRKRRKLHESEDDLEIKDQSLCEEDDEEEVIDTVQDDEKIPKDVEVEINEGLRLLSKGNYKKFNESYRNTKLLKNGKINFLVESERTGRMYSVVRKINAVQRANYKLAESMTTSKVSRRAAASAKLESVRAARTSLAALTEMNAIKVAAMRMLERQGIRFDYKTMNESLNRTISESSKRFRKKFEAIDSDKETGAIDFVESTPEEIAQDVTEVVKDTGLEVVTQEVDASTDTAAVQVRVQDDPNLEVNLQDIADAASEVMDVPVAVVGPSKPEGDSTLADITVLVNPDEDTVDEGDKVALSESLRTKIRSKRLAESRRGYSRRMNESDDLDPMTDEPKEDDDDIEDYPKLSERRRSVRRRRLSESEDPAVDPVDTIDADDEESEEGKLPESRVRKIKEADDGICDDDESKIVITEEDDDDEETKDLIDQAKKLEEKIRNSRKRK